MNSNSKIDFYKDGAVHTVLKRYSFTDDERKVIHAAIVTAKRDKPNMLVIQKADDLLKFVTKSQDPATTEDFKMDNASLLEMAKYQGKKEKKGDFPWIIALVILQVIGIIIINQYVFDDADTEPPKLYTFSEANTLCLNQGKVLPLTSRDAPGYMDIPNELNALGYWTADQKVFYNLAIGYGMKADGKKHYAVCVDTNGKGIVRR